MAQGMVEGPAECAELPGDFRGSETSKNRASDLSTPQLPCKQGLGGLNTPSGGTPPAPHFAMCRSGLTEADEVEFKTEMSSDLFWKLACMF